nr:hypothetical protein [Tanacetum cinerariifolium]
MGSKEEAERIKRKGLNLEHESAKKQKTSEEVPEKVKSPEEIPEEKVKEMMQLVPIEEVYVEALQVKHPIINWKDKEIFMLVEKDYPLRQGLALVMISYKLQVENYSQMFPIIHQPIRKKTCAELLAEEHEATINTQPFQYSVVPQPPREEISVEFLQEKRNQINSMKTFLRKFNRICFYEMPKVLSLAWETIIEIELAFEDKHCQPEDILELF